MDDSRALKSFGKKVRDFRKALGASQDELAERAQTSRETISNIERGVFFCTLPTLCRIADFVGRNLDEFFVDTPRVRKPVKDTAIDTAVAQFRNMLASGEKLSASDVAVLLSAVAKADRAKAPAKTARKRRVN